MCCRTRLLTLGFLTVLAAGCGHKGPPLPPPLKNPAPTTDLAVQQRGSELLVTFSYPQTTLSGELLTDLESVEYWELKRPVPGWSEGGGSEEAATESAEEASDLDEPSEPTTPDDPEEPAEEGEESSGEEPKEEEDDEGEADDDFVPPPPSKEQLVAVEPLEFQATAQLRLTLAGAELKSAIAGDSIVMRFPLDPDPTEELGHIFAVKTFSGPRLGSPFSNLATLVRRTPPAPPAGFNVEAVPAGVHITWENEAAAVEADSEGDAESGMDATDGEETEDGPSGFHIYRRDAQSRSYGQPLVKLPGTAAHHFDRTAQYGNRYIYSVTTVAETRPLIESALAGEREIDYQDRFAPPPPINLVALAEPGRVRLLWDASRVSDLGGYVVFRRVGDGEFLRLNSELITDPEYNDLAVAAGTSYDYQVAAVDQIGNQSDPGAPVSALVP